MTSFFNLLQSAQSGFLKNVLSGAGLTLATSGTLLVAINKLIDTMRDNVTNIPPAALALADAAGFDYYISIVLGAILTKYVQSSTRLTLIRKD
ncbi:MAG: DUF2523 domain-containing protein [Moraxella sp.]|nr:MAG: DUF2523 domain-containing protein [Moraxella sp.]